MVAATAMGLMACPRQKGPEAPVTVTCDNVGASIAQELAATAGEGSGSADPSMEALDRATIAAVVESCTADKWTDAARACFVDARSQASEKCGSQLTEAQALALDDRMDSAAAKVAPADCSELEPLIISSLAAEVEQSPATDREALQAKIGSFAATIGTLCAGGWSVEARTCVRDATRGGEAASRCARWLDDAQRNAYQDAVQTAFGAPPDGAASPPPPPSP